MSVDLHRSSSLARVNLDIELSPTVTSLYEALSCYIFALQFSIEKFLRYRLLVLQSSSML